MADEIKLLTRFGKILKDFFVEAKSKLDTLSVVNLLGLFILVLFATLDAASNFALTLIYVIPDILSQVIAGRGLEQPIIDPTPFMLYAAFLLSGLTICLVIVALNQKGKIWSNQGD